MRAPGARRARTHQIGLRTDERHAYVSAVHAAVGEVFPEVLTAPVEAILARALDAQLREPAAHFEVIVDHPAAANWRLKGAERPGGFRVADYRLLGRCERPEIEALNQRLADLATTHLN